MMEKEYKSFQIKVYTIVATLKPGQVLTYGQIALLLGEPKRARHVGQAMSRAPAEMQLPCHRVVNAKGEMAPPGVFEAGTQRMRLEAEGVPFRANGCIDWKQYHQK